MKLVILARDGVVNQVTDSFIKSPDEWTPIPGSIEAIARLTHAGYTIVIATNQSGIAKKEFDISILNAVHEKMHVLVHQAGGHIDGIFYCPHSAQDQCNCRKPLPGLLFQISRRFSISLETVPFIGDSESDIEAAKLAGAQPLLVRTGKMKNIPVKIQNDGIPVFNNLAEAANHVISH